MPERNPFEETRQAAQDWSPREQYISRPNTTVGPRNKEVYETRGGDQLGFVQRESDRLSPSGRFTHQGDTIYGPYPRSNSVAMRQVFHPSTGRKSGEAYKSPYGTTTSMTVEPEWYAQRGYDFSYDPGVFDYPMMGESADLYFNNYQRGGSVNPHEETMKAARDWSPREQYISRSNQGRAYDATVNRFIQGRQDEQQRWEQGGGQGAYPVINQPGESFNVPMSPGWLQASSDRNNSGLMLAMADSPAVNKMKNIYSQVDPFFPNVDPIDQQIGYDFDKNLWGGTLGFGGGYDIDDENYNAYANWGTTW